MKIYKNKENYQVSITEGQRFNYKPTSVMPYGGGWQYNDNITCEEEVYPNGAKNVVYYATSYRVSKKMSIDDMINALIRCYYNINDELAIQRQRDTKPEKFEEYNTDVKKIIEVSKILYAKF